MACIHKFLADLQLGYVNWEVKTLFIGTFNPGWKECKNNYSEWFYGRTKRNDFWCILPKLHQSPSLINGNRESWIDFCRKNKIAITDIIREVTDADVYNPVHLKDICSYQDNRIGNYNFAINDIPAILERFPSIKQICITRTTLPQFWLNCFHDTFDYIDLHPERGIMLLTLRSPSRAARRGVVGPFCDFVANQWIESGYQTNL